MFLAEIAKYTATPNPQAIMTDKILMIDGILILTRSDDNSFRSALADR
jgi:hypothetical protein